ncbi:MAG: nucleoside kinase [Fretibacterium sp.]|nr:nucleoside kinase [Fretibacterium sp.]
MAFTICVLTASKKREQYIARSLNYEEGVTGHQALADLNARLRAGAEEDLELVQDEDRVIGWFVNNYTRPLGWGVDDNAMAEFIQINSPAGLRIYQRSLDFLMVIACERVFGASGHSSPQRKVALRHSIGEGHYWEFEDGPVTQEDVDRIRAEMRDLVRRDLPITREVLTIDKARRIFHEQGDLEISELFGRANLDPVEVYHCKEQEPVPGGEHAAEDTPVDRYGYFCGTPLAPSTGMLRTFDIIPFAHGMVLQFPTTETAEGELPPFQVDPSVGEVFFDYARWLDVLNLNYLNKLHHRVTDNKVQELILISEAFHSQRLSNIAEDIASRPVKVVTIAGPSGSGKTTFSERLKVQLMVCGKTPVTLPLDNYFKERVDSPRDENGEYDFERIEALDLDLLENNLKRILAGEGVQTPVYNFITGKKEPGKVIKLHESDVLIMEGIHGLNDHILSMLPEETRYGVFVSPLTGICIDPHNRTSTGDNRLLRRIIRDYRTRGRSAQGTLEISPKVMRGAKRYIFPYQRRANSLFNSSLPYELGVLKPYVEPLLHTVDENAPVFSEALRLLNILRFVPSINNDGIPNNSVIREFIGGSCLDV